MDDKLREEIALFRYGVISELVSSRLDPGELTQLINNKVSSVGIFPVAIVPGYLRQQSGAGYGCTRIAAGTWHRCIR